jgi:hypothetical protein
VWNLVSEIKGGTQTESVREQAVEENILRDVVLYNNAAGNITE